MDQHQTARLASALLAVSICLLPPRPVAAAETASRSVIYPRIAKACPSELAKFCPALSATPTEGRNQAICLRPFAMSLSMNCRQTVSAAFR